MVARNMLWVFFSCLESSFLALMFFFSSLDRRKEAKEDQGVRAAGQVGLVPGKLPCPGRGRQGRRGKLAGYMIRVIVYPAIFAGGRSRLPANLAAYLSHWVGGSDAFFTEEFVEIDDGLL